MTLEKTIPVNDSILWTPINIKLWDKTPAINGRVATEEDVKMCSAVYYINNNGVEHNWYKIQLPKLAYLTDSETKKEELVVVIQVETTAKDTIAGYRNIGGGNGACLFYELRFLDAKTVKTIVGK